MTTYSQSVRENLARSNADDADYAEGFHDYLSMKTLARKRIERFGSPMGANATPLAFSDQPELVRNLCVRVDAIRLAELDALINVLGCSKQEFILELLVAGMAQARSMLARDGLQQAYEGDLDDRIEKAGFTVEPSPNEGYWTLHYRGNPLKYADYETHTEAAGSVRQLIEGALSVGDRPAEDESAKS